MTSPPRERNMIVLKYLLLSGCFALAVRADQAILGQSPSNQPRVVITINTPISASPTEVDVILGRVDAKKVFVLAETRLKPEPVGTSAQRLTWDLSAPLTLTDHYRVSIPRLPTLAGLRQIELEITRGLNGEIIRSTATGCPGLVLQLSSDDDEVLDSAFHADLSALGPTALLKLWNSGSTNTVGMRTINSQTPNWNSVKASRTILWCLVPDQSLRIPSFDAVVKFSTGPYALAGQEFSGSDLSLMQSQDLSKAGDAIKAPENRDIERNLSLGISYTAFRDVKKNVYQRYGVLDLRLAPWLDIRTDDRSVQNAEHPQRWYSYWTPAYVDANVTPSAIVATTVAMNRVELGSEVELRYIPYQSRLEDGRWQTVTQPYQTFHRFLFTGLHYSDRDFKQLEYAGKFTYQLLHSRLVRPLASRSTPLTRPATGKPYMKPATLGWDIRPKVGTEWGQTYERRNPANAIKTSDFIKRGFAGLEASLEVTRHLTLSFSETVYIRGEIAAGHVVNYLKAELLLPIPLPLNNTGHALFFKYERGSLPPFDTLNANSLLVGYRILSDGWFGHHR
jgi:hypothetical protein